MVNATQKKMRKKAKRGRNYRKPRTGNYVTAREFVFRTKTLFQNKTSKNDLEVLFILFEHGKLI